MDLRDYYALIANAPMPTQRQFEEFAKHVAQIHSWYKGSLDGNEFVVWLDPDAGNGLTPNVIVWYQPHLTPNGYVERFGHLTYAWRHSAEYSFSGDHVDPQRVVDLPPEILKDCGGRLYPFGRHMPGGPRVLTGRMRTELLALEAGERDHPCRELLLECFRMAPRYLELDWAVEQARSHVAAVAVRDTGGATPEWSYRTADPSYMAAERQLDAQARLLAHEEQLSEVRAKFNPLWKKLIERSFQEITGALLGLEKHLRMAGIQG